MSASRTETGTSLLAVTLLLVGGLSIAALVVSNRSGQALTVAAGVALVLVGHVFRLADSLDFLPGFLTPGVDDEGAVATLLGLSALLVGGMLVVGPVTTVLDVRTHWMLALFGLLVSVLLVVHVFSAFALAD